MTLFVLIDTATHNVLGEFASRHEASTLRAQLIEADERVEDALLVQEIAGAEAPEAATDGVTLR